MDFADFEQQRRFHEAWEMVQIVRPVHHSLFTFGETTMAYFLVLNAEAPATTISITRGDVRVTRPLIITPDNARPEFQNFFDDTDDEMVAQFILARTAVFSHLKFQNQSGPMRIVTDCMEEAVARLNRQLDADDEEHVAIITAPAKLASFAIFRYATERVWQSAPDNLQELRERGFLP